MSGIEVSAFCLGSWLTFERLERPVALSVMSAAIEAGVDFLDDARYDDHTGTAPLKTGWSEVLFGDLFRTGGWARESFTIADKLWFEFWPEQPIAEELDGSLGRLGMDWLDLVYCAPPPDSLSLPQLLDELTELIEQGGLRAWGVLNWPPALLAEAHALATSSGLVPPCAAQLPHNLIDRGFVEGPSAADALAKTGVAVVASHCLAGGLLSGKYSQPGAQGRLGTERIEGLRQRGVLDRVDDWARLAEKHGATPAQLALAFSLSRPAVASVCFGATSPSQVEENLAALDLLPHLADAMATLEAEGTPEDPPDE
jgi:aryl-alcohol dehydrogenase-like predicted oxidoreductase